MRNLQERKSKYKRASEVLLDILKAYFKSRKFCVTKRFFLIFEGKISSLYRKRQESTLDRNDMLVVQGKS